MQLIDIGDIIQLRSGKSLPKWALSILRRLIHEQEINTLIRDGYGLQPLPFLQHVFQSMRLKYRIHGALPPTDKRYIFVANHPFGGVDGMILAEILLQHFTDVGVVANDLLMHIEPLRPLWIPINKFGRQNILCSHTYNHAMSSPTKQIITFPAGICSRWINGSVMDMKWHNRFIRDAIHYKRLVVPIYIVGKLFSRFYAIYRLRKLLGINTNVELSLLVDELFRQKGETIDIFFGDTLDVTTLPGSITAKRDMVRQKVYEMAR
ncbi:MAG: acyltransferase [Alistipes sp.]|nr:acyltransferase [Alistipes sp.]